MSNNHITRIVLTGGPCAGKTTTLALIIEHFTQKGYKVFAVPEVPTIFTQAGMDYLTPNKQFFYEGEKATLEVQLLFEDRFYRMAQACTEPCIIVFDRGTMDISAYMQPEMWEEITGSVGTSTEELIKRYDAIFHLKTAAHGAAQYYNTVTNAQRYEAATEEGLQIARMLDDKVMAAWSSHPHRMVIGTHDDFVYKMNQVISGIEEVLK